MFSKLIPNMAKHFLFSVLQHDSESAERISCVISKLRSEQIIDFLMSLGGFLDGHNTILEHEIPKYDEVKQWTCDRLIEPENNSKSDCISGGHFGNA